jgi:hypothetical protein
MTAASPLVFPGGRVLAGWWPKLAPLRPRSLWVAHLLLHRVEALVEVTRRAEVDRFSNLVVQALNSTPGRTVPDLDAWLHLGPQVLGQVLRRLQDEGLAKPLAGGGWAATDRGRQLLEQGGYTRTGHERRVFHFLDRPGEPAGNSPTPPLLPLRLPAEAPFPAPEGWAFDPAWLDVCLRQADDWKREHGFPLEANRIVPLDAVNGGAVPAWQPVILDRPERLVALVARVAEEGKGDRLVGFGVRPEGWALEAGQPAFVLTSDWREVLPQVTEELPPEAWRQAWRAWCQPRALPPAEVEASTLERQDYRLRVTAPRRLVERLRQARSDALKGEAWLLAGTGSVREMALLELVEAGA